MRVFLFICIQIMYRLIIEHIIRKLVLEARSQSTTRKVRDAIVKASHGELRPASTPNRIFSNISPEKFKDYLKDYGSVEVIPAGKGDSSKFPTFIFDDEEGNPVRIVLATGKIAGAEEEEKQKTNISRELEGKKIVLHVGNKAYNDIDGFKKIEGNKKADFAFTSDGESVIFIQYKSPTHQQMSGIKKFMNADGTSSYEEINDLITQTRAKVGADEHLVGKVSVPIDNERLERLAVYGTDEKDPTFSENVVEVYAIDDLKLIKLGENEYKLTAPTLYTYPKIPTGPNKPTLVATYRKGRNQAGIKNVRLGIYPASYAGKS
jgi:hypothetical protein